MLPRISDLEAPVHQALVQTSDEALQPAHSSIGGRSRSGQSFLAAALAGSDEILDRSCARNDTKNEVPAAQRSFAQPAACRQVPAKLTPEPTKHEARKRRANERHAVGCSEELGRFSPPRVP